MRTIRTTARWHSGTAGSLSAWPSVGPMADVPHAPWRLSGECLVGLARGRDRLPLPAGLAPLPGPSVVVAARYSDSPVGPYTELAVGSPARLGARAGLCITTMVVDSPDSRVGGRGNWGFPKELGTLAWWGQGDERVLRWEERDLVVRGTARGPASPLVVPMRSLQRRADGPVVVPWHLRGRARLGNLEVTVPENDGLGALAGRHPALVVSGFALVMQPARRPAGPRATLRAPLQVPEPALSWGGQPAHPGD